MKKLGSVAMAALLASGALFAQQADAQQTENQVKTIKEEIVETNLITYNGIIKEIVKGENYWTVYTESKEKGETHVILDKDSYVFNRHSGSKLALKDLQVGDELAVYYDRQKPMLMIYPPQIAPEFVIVKDREHDGNVKVGLFDENFLSLDGELKLNISEDTILENQTGEKLKTEKLAGKDLIVFYDVTTRSLPPQTTPTKIITFDPLVEMVTRVNSLIEEDHLFKNKSKMIPLRKVAEELGFTVIADKELKGAYVTFGNSSFQILWDSKQYGYNRSVGYFKEKTFVKNNKTYVSEELVELLIDHVETR